jgi:hypothetical protein
MAAERVVDPRRIEILDEAVVEVLRAKTVAERLAMAFDAERTMRLMLEAHLRSQHPDWDDSQIAGEIARRRLLGSD